MLRRKFLFLGGVFILFHHALFAQSAPGPGPVYTLQQCVDSALKNNPTVKQSELTKESAKINWDQQRANMLPNISAYGNYVSNSGRSLNIYTYTYTTQTFNSGYYQLSGSLTLWNGFSIQNLIRQYSLLYEADKMDWQQAKDQMTVNVILAYLNVLSTQEQLSMARTQVEATRGKVKLLEIQNNEGSIAPSALSDMKGQFESDQLTLVTTQNALESYKLALAQLMNIPYSPDLQVQALAEDLTPLAYNGTIDQIYQSATQNLAQVKAANLHLASAIKGVKAYRGNMLPTLSVFGQVYTNYSSTANTQQLLNTTFDSTGSYAKGNTGNLPVYVPNNHYQNQPISFGSQFKNNVNTQVGLALNIPLLNGLRSRTLYRQAKVALEQAKFNASTTLIQLRQAVESYYVTMMAAFRTYNGLSRQVQDYDESFRAAEIRFNSGAVTALTSLDYLNAKNNIDRAKLSLIQAKYNYILQTKVLDYFQGKLTW